jgi:hypothetical protein
MLPLPELQQRFAHALTGSQAVALPVRGNGLSGEQRLQVYRNNMQSALMGALRDVYPVTERLVGQEFFTAAAFAYLKTNPSHSGNIQDYGGVFPQFLNGFEPAASLPYLGDVAALEWRRLQSAIAPSHVPMDVAALAAVPAELQPELHFRHQPAARTFCSRFPVLTIWEYCQSAAPEAELDIGLPGECVLFARPQLDVYMRRLTPGEYAFLHQLWRGQSFEAACRQALEVEPEFDVEQNFAELVREEILTGFYH